MIQQFGKQIVFTLSFIFIATAAHSQESAKLDFNNSVNAFKNLMNGDKYELLLHQNIYLYDLNEPMETNWQHFVKNGDEFYYQTNGMAMISFSDCRIVIDSAEKVIYLTDVAEKAPSMNFLFGDSILNIVNVEKKELKDRLVFNINMFSLNMEIESVQYHFDKISKNLISVIIYHMEGEYYEDESHINEKQSPVQEIVIDKLVTNKVLIPAKEDVILKKKNEYIVASGYSDYLLKDIREK